MENGPFRGSEPVFTKLTDVYRGACQISERLWSLNPNLADRDFTRFCGMTFVRLMNKVVWIQLKIHHIEIDTWWRHQMETYSASLALCAGNSPAPDEFPAKRPVTQSFDVFFDLRPNRRLSKRGEAGDMKRHRAHYDVIVMRIQAVFADITPAVTL